MARRAPVTTRRGYRPPPRPSPAPSPIPDVYARRFMDTDPTGERPTVTLDDDAAAAVDRLLPEDAR
jgi:hypothetical protein